MVNPRRTVKTEAKYQLLAQKLDDDGGHGYKDHGAQTTEAQQVHRLKTGVKPGGDIRPAPYRASKFTQHESQVKASEIAFQKLAFESRNFRLNNGRYEPSPRIRFSFYKAGLSYSLDSSGNSVERVLNNVTAFFECTDLTKGTYRLISIFPST